MTIKTRNPISNSRHQTGEEFCESPPPPTYSFPKIATDTVFFLRVPKGAPIRHYLLPLVLAQVEREMRGLQVGLEHTLEFLQAVCPVFDDCDLLLALGSGEVPAPFARYDASLPHYLALLYRHH
jgi:hypothetical protein